MFVIGSWAFVADHMVWDLVDIGLILVPTGSFNTGQYEFWPLRSLVDGHMTIICLPTVKVGPYCTALVMLMFILLWGLFLIQL